MNLLTPEQITAAQKAFLDTVSSLSTKAFEGIEKLTELNIQTAKSALRASQENAQRILGIKDPQEFLALQSSLAHPVTEKILSYNRELYGIFSTIHTEIAHAAETQCADFNQRAHALAENVARNAPAGSETAVAVMKSVMTAANTTYDTVQKATKQAVAIAEGNFNAATSAASRVAQQASLQAEQAARAAKKG